MIVTNDIKKTSRATDVFKKCSSLKHVLTVLSVTGKRATSGSVSHCNQSLACVALERQMMSRLRENHYFSLTVNEETFHEAPCLTANCRSANPVNTDPSHIPIRGSAHRPDNVQSFILTGRTHAASQSTPSSSAVGDQSACRWYWSRLTGPMVSRWVRLSSRKRRLQPSTQAARLCTIQWQ